MRILLDECVPKKLAELLPDHTVVTVPDIGWASIKNGELLNLAASDFDILITVDKKMAVQHSPATLKLPVVIIKGKSTQFKHLRKYTEELRILLQL